MLEQLSLIPLPTWVGTKDGDEAAAALFRRHYSYHHYADNRRSLVGYRNRFLICGPGEKMVLLSPEKTALFVWRKFIDKCPGQTGINCAVFRNESTQRASNLILAAEQLAWKRWPGQRLYTYVNPQKIKSSRTPGRCFLKADWRYCGVTGSGLLILEKVPQW